MLELFLDLENSKHKLIYDLSIILLKGYSIYKPTIVGTFPINIDIETSDIDVIMTTDDMETMFHNLKQSFGQKEGFKIKYEDVIICSFLYKEFEFELYISTEAVETLNSYRHLVIEKRLLKLFGKTFRKEIIELKQKGIKTEPAFALLLGLYGNPYDKMLELEKLSDEALSELKWSNELKQISFYDDLELVYFDKGWSYDLKFIGNDFEYLIRLSPTSSNRAIIFENATELSQSINCSRPVEFYSTACNIEVYEWLEGKDLEDNIHLLSKKKQYLLGIEAGKYLKEIHTITGTSIDWHEKYYTKIQTIIRKFLACGIKMPDEKVIIDYLENNHLVLKERPITFQHGDYHLGNMLISESETLGVIDFNRASYGDPWEEYDRIAFSYRRSPYFAIGQLHGDFGEIPDKFFDVVAVYSALNCLAGIPWALMYGDEDVRIMKENYMSIKENYSNFNTVIPKWYSDNIEEVQSWNLMG